MHVLRRGGETRRTLPSRKTQRQTEEVVHTGGWSFSSSSEPPQTSGRNRVDTEISFCHLPTDTHDCELLQPLPCARRNRQGRRRDSLARGLLLTSALRPAKQSQAGAAAIDEEGGLVHAVARSFVHKRRAKDGWPDEWVVAQAHDRSP